MDNELPAPMHRHRILQSPTPIPRSPHHRGEPELRMAIVRMLRANGIAVETSVPCAAGAADIVTVRRDAIFEVKHRLSRPAIYQGLGQLLCYRSCINAQARAILIGYATADTEILGPHVAALGVELVTWRDEMAGRAVNMDTEATTGASSISSSNSLPERSMLRWNVAQLARARGYSNVMRLAQAMGSARQGIYAIWRDEAIQISLTTLARLARALNADVGDWFVWGMGDGDQGMGDAGEGTHGADTAPVSDSDVDLYRDFLSHSPFPNPQPLSWNVRARMAAIGLNPIDLAFAAQLYSGSVIPIVDGVAQAVHVETLGKLAQALEAPEVPFRIGDLFIWTPQWRTSTRSEL